MSVKTLRYLLTIVTSILIFAAAFYLSGGFKLLIAEKNQDAENPVLINSLPQYKDKKIMPMGNKIIVNNLPIDLGYFTTKDEISEVRDELMQKFKSAGLTPHYNSISEDEGFIQAVDRKSGEQRIFILKRGEGETMVFAGIAPTLSNNLIVKPDKTLGIPEEAINYIEVRNMDYGRSARTISFQLKGDKEKNLAIFKERLKSLGFEENEFLKQYNYEGVIAFEKDGIQIMTVVMEDEDRESHERTTSFVLNVMERKDEKD